MYGTFNTLCNYYTNVKPVYISSSYYTCALTTKCCVMFMVSSCVADKQCHSTYNESETEIVKGKWGLPQKNLGIFVGNVGAVKLLPRAQYRLSTALSY